MGRNRRRITTFQQLVDSLEPSEPHEAEVWVSAVDTGVIEEHDGARWRLKRGPLDARVARRLAARAELMVMEHGGSTRLREIPAQERAEIWERVSQRYEGPSGVIKGGDWPEEPVYCAYEFVSDDGRSMLLLDEAC